MHISKTLFTEFTTTPKLTWFHVHDKEVYNQILEAEYGVMDGAEIGQSIEDQVKELLGTHTIVTPEGDYDAHKSIIDQLHTDLEGGQHGTFIVWFKGFENKRNEETALMYPEYKTFFESVNAKTFDLMEVFSEFHYFDRRFKGSASIKKVLPVLTDISYNGLEVPNGAVATGLLLNIATGKLTGEPLTTQRKNLLTYCEQDTWAMVRIWQELLQKIQLS